MSFMTIIHYIVYKFMTIIHFEMLGFYDYKNHYKNQQIPLKDWGFEDSKFNKKTFPVSW